MKTLLLLRHAKAASKEAGIPDHDRPLKKRGQRDARAVGELLKQEQLVPELVLSSSALRARTTAEGVLQACNYEGHVELLEQLYLASAQTYVEVLRGIDNHFNRLLVVGHNPGMEELVELLGGHHIQLPTAALALSELDIDRWHDLQPQHAALRQIWRPKEMD